MEKDLNESDTRDAADRFMIQSLHRIEKVRFLSNSGFYLINIWKRNINSSMKLNKKGDANE